MMEAVDSSQNIKKGELIKIKMSCILTFSLMQLCVFINLFNIDAHFFNTCWAVI